MSVITYLGPHPEVYFALPIPFEGQEVRPWPFRGRMHHIEAVALTPSHPMRKGRWVAVWLAGMRCREGPWFRVHLTPEEWRACQRQAPWLQKATDMRAFTSPTINDTFWQRYRDHGHEEPQVHGLITTDPCP